MGIHQTSRLVCKLLAPGWHLENLTHSAAEMTGEVNHGTTHNGLRYLQNECPVASVSSSSEVLSELSFDRQHRGTEMVDYQVSVIPPDFFVCVCRKRRRVIGKVEASDGRRGCHSAEQLEDSMHHR
jgi:hypothetical protein